MTAEEKDEVYRLRKLMTENPLGSDAEMVARFNGEDVVDRLLQFIRAEKPYFRPFMEPADLFAQYYVHPKMSNRRILAQSGAFILYGLEAPKAMFRPYTLEETRFVVPKGKKRRIRKALDNIGVNESTLFPEIDKAAARIKESYRIEVPLPSEG